MKDEKEIWTDGGCEPNPGLGAWAWICDEGVRGSGTVNNSTNNRMELQAILESIQSNRNKSLIIYSDSEYCVNGINQWMHKWEKNSWKKRKGEIKNLDLWKIIYSECKQNKILLIWVRGHSGNLGNEEADMMVNQKIREARGEVDPRIFRPMKTNYEIT